MKGLTRWQRMLPASSRLAYFPSKPIVLQYNKWERLRRIAQGIPLSLGAQLRLEWIFSIILREKRMSRRQPFILVLAGRLFTSG